MIPSQMPAWLPESLREDPKKAGILGVLVLVLVAVVIRYLLMGGPATAQATTPRPDKKTGNKQTTKSTIVQPGTGSQARALKQWLETPVSSVSRNLFAIRQEFYPSQAGQSSNKKNDESGFWDEIEKSRNVQADQKRQREILIENLQRDAARLRLQSTVMGPEPQAIIDGRLVKEGDVVASDGPKSGVQFRVLTIESRRVIIEHEGIKLELRMIK